MGHETVAFSFQSNDSVCLAGKNEKVVKIYFYIYICKTIRIDNIVISKIYVFLRFCFINQKQYNLR
jgi:hypothetical protein